MNILNEAISTLAENKRTYKDIEFISMDNTWFNWHEFMKVADKDLPPDKVNKSLQIIGNNFTMNWTSNDKEGEWWFVEVLPERPPVYKKPISLL